MTKVNVKAIIEGIDKENLEYIMGDNRFISDIGTMERFEEKGNVEMVNFCLEGIKERAREYNDRFLTPANVKVGDGVTMHLYSDAHAGTVIKKTNTSLTIQRDKATRDPNFKPEFSVGGFAGHCSNQNEQTYTYEQDPNGETVIFRWSKKYNEYRNSKRGQSLTKGRREFYDYNF